MSRTHKLAPLFRLVFRCGRLTLFPSFSHIVLLLDGLAVALAGIVLL